MTHQHGGRELRTDIQGLRALAVAMVVVYHLDHGLLPGGFVGVDVFFVISGFLITAHLLRKPPASPADLLGFWGRRIRRLLPASLLVLGCSLALVRLVAPETQWEPTAQDTRAAALYIVNWSMADRAVDYLASENAPTAVQHFWSLSVEEQFYFFWPILIGLAVLLGRRLRIRRTTALTIAMGSVVAASLLFSVAHTASDPAAAYFITPTRIWELGAGGLLALAVARMTTAGLIPGPRLVSARQAGSWAGLVMIGATGVLYSGATPFPGYQAALPVLGTLLVILCAPPPQDGGGAGRLLASAPAQWLGDISYSVYLWHFPLIVLAPAALGHEPGFVMLVAVLATTLGLAALTERFVERPFRAPELGRTTAFTYTFAVAAMAVVVAVATVQLVEVQRIAERNRIDLALALDTPGPCFGAAALDDHEDCGPVSYRDLLPTPALAAKDKSRAYKDVGGRQCWSFTPSFPDRTCSFGKRRSDVRIALVGNSHAGQWLPAVRQVAREHGWRIDTYLASQCASSDMLQSFETLAHSEACRDWVKRTTKTLERERPNLVVMSNRVSVTALGEDLEASQAVYADGFQRVIGRLHEKDLRLLTIRDTPAPGVSVPDCIADHEEEYTTCDGARSAWLPNDPAVDVVEAYDDPHLRVADLTDRICEGPTCHVVNGGVITYFDASHLTATYALTLAPYLEPHMVHLVEGEHRGHDGSRQGG